MVTLTRARRGSTRQQRGHEGQEEQHKAAERTRGPGGAAQGSREDTRARRSSTRQQRGHEGQEEQHKAAERTRGPGGAAQLQCIIKTTSLQKIQVNNGQSVYKLFKLIKPIHSISKPIWGTNSLTLIKLAISCSSEFDQFWIDTKAKVM